MKKSSIVKYLLSWWQWTQNHRSWKSIIIIQIKKLCNYRWSHDSHRKWSVVVQLIEGQMIKIKFSNPQRCFKFDWQVRAERRNLKLVFIESINLSGYKHTGHIIFGRLTWVSLCTEKYIYFQFCFEVCILKYPTDAWKPITSLLSVKTWGLSNNNCNIN